MSEQKLSIYDLRKNVFDNINSNKIITASTKTALLKQYNDAFITTDKKGNVYKRTVQSQRTQLNKLNDKINEFDVKAPTLQKVNIKIKVEKKKEEVKKVVLVKKTKKDEYNVDASINKPDMVTTVYNKGEPIQTSKSYTRDLDNIFNILAKYDGKEILIKYIVAGEIIFEYEYNSTNNPGIWDYSSTSGSTIFWSNDYEGDIII